ncbi:phenylalanyl-tRNA synthetase beta subunit [Robiginitalea myxolifaciens]|uniref:Phenylalanine--tRNA ligase beta subunit n=1 Tax=Robiginitalea myxolifaciens TaxID=400055 RepID=A0A1I6GTS0_9FLAO|nr:phenylalanine--tRNA ligase subunit beta [Robiginitalea myxolifaciens]SFR45481.1 phenylalanyl-tRNA synthetase beta subunit [Robiginitalea myxolifaciens]
MKISYNWLKQFLEIERPVAEIGEMLTDLGLEVEGISTFQSVQGGLEGIVVGQVVECEQHPNADRLKLCKVDVGNEEPLQIVCGAPNVAKGQKAPVAVVGATLYPTNAEPWKVKKGKIRGELSQGMLCAEDELGLGSSHEGILVLETDRKPGTPCAEIFEIETDHVFEIGLTPNRADAMSHFGVARDLRAGLKRKEISKELITPSLSSFAVDSRSLRIEIEVENPALAPRYAGITLTNLIIEDSPHWLKNRLRAIGLNPINNVVDATNYVMHELGQPLHAFDADRIHGKKVLVKTVSAGTEFMTLDGEMRKLHAEDLMICDAEKPMCIAGVFGGINTGVTEHTKSIFLESAYFDPVSVRKTAKRHGLNTDASFRFERGIDIELVEYALQRAAILIRDLAGGEISSDLTDLYPQKFPERNVFLSLEKIYGLIGDEIPRDTLIEIMASLDIQVKSVTESGFGLLIPSYRVDVTRDVDVIEEILRVYGYNNIPDKEKITASIHPVGQQEPHQLREILTQRLAALGCYEILGNSLCSPTHNELLGNTAHKPVELLNPLGKELSQLRQDMLFSGLQALVHNMNRQHPDLRIFEFGKIYGVSKGKRWESERLALLLSGKSAQSDWTQTSRALGFFHLKSLVFQVLEGLGVNQWTEKPVEDSRFSESLEVVSDKKSLVRFGVVDKKFTAAFDIEQEVVYADMDWSLLVAIAASRNFTYQPISKFPEVRRDFALLLDDSAQFSEVRDLAFRTEKKLLQDVQLFDVYKGKNLPKDRKSYAVSFLLQDPAKTLKDQQIDKVMKRLQTAFEKELGAELR